MAKTPLDEKWRYCSRCGFRHQESQLWLDPASGNEYCLQQVHCKDEPDRDQLRKQYFQKGRVFSG